MKKALTDRGLRALKAAPVGKRTMLWDANLPSFGVRVTDKGHASFIVMRRLNGKLIRDVVGSFNVGSYPRQGGPLARAREAARSSIALIQEGVAPKSVKEGRALEAQRLERESFAAVSEEFIARHVSKLKTKREVTNAIRRELVGRWGSRPLRQVTRRDVVGMLEEVTSSGRPYMAHHLLAYTRKLFNWAIARDLYGLENSPCDRVKARGVIGVMEPRQRVLADGELRAVWQAIGADLGYPFGPFVRMLLITGQRLNEVAMMQWPEIDFDKALWTIPSERMKGGIAHEVPLSDAARTMLGALPRFSGKGTGSFAFTTTSGERPISGFSKAKIRIDAVIAEELGAALPGWRFHDLRRTMRTHLGGLPIPSDVAEMVIAHRQSGVRAVYDLHGYRDEKRRALALWASRLMSIVEPTTGGNVVPLPQGPRFLGPGGP